jgi:hypothetical protein
MEMSSRSGFRTPAAQPVARGYSLNYCDVFEVTWRKHVSTAVNGDFCYKAWTVAARSRDNAQTLLLEAVFPATSARDQRISQFRSDLASRRSRPEAA